METTEVTIIEKILPDGRTVFIDEDGNEYDQMTVSGIGNIFQTFKQKLSTPEGKNFLKNVGGKIVGVFKGRKNRNNATNTQSPQTVIVQERQPQARGENKPQTKNKTLMYVGIGVGALVLIGGVAFALTRKKAA